MRLAGLVLIAALLSVIDAQTPAPPGSRNLELRLQAERVEREVPQAFTFLLVNKTDHDVRVPVPAIDCENSFDGWIGFRLEFTPFQPGDSGEGHGCAGDRTDWPPILDRVKEWKILRTGDTLTLHADRTRLLYDDSRAGIYVFWAQYRPPSIDRADQKTLQEAGLDFPRGAPTTPHMVFVKER